MRTVLIAVPVVLLVACSQRSETSPVVGSAVAPAATVPASSGPALAAAPPVDGTAPAEAASVGSGAASPGAHPGSTPGLASAVPAGAVSTDPGACADLEALEDKIGDGLLSAAEETCLLARLAVASDDAERYYLVHLLGLDLDANGRGAEAQALRLAHMPRIDCDKVEARLKEVCGLFRAAAK